MELVKIKSSQSLSNQSLVVEQIDRAIRRNEEKASNSLSMAIRQVAKAFVGGMLTTSEFIRKIEDLKSTHPSELQEIQDADLTLLALCNARHMLQ